MALDPTEQLVLCDTVNEFFNERHLTVEDRLGVLGSMIGGTLRAGLAPEMQAVILYELYIRIGEHLGHAPHH